MRELKEETGYVGVVREDEGVVMFNGSFRFLFSFLPFFLFRFSVIITQAVANSKRQQIPNMRFLSTANDVYPLYTPKRPNPPTSIPPRLTVIPPKQTPDSATPTSAWLPSTSTCPYPRTKPPNPNSKRTSSSRSSPCPWENFTRHVRYWRGRGSLLMREWARWQRGWRLRDGWGCIDEDILGSWT